MSDDVLDEDGYPHDPDLEKIKAWPYTDPLGLMAFVKERWVLALWHEEEWSADWEYGEHEKDKRRFCISTAGWSGNESIIEAMQKNMMFWCMNWFSSRRGGHYEFRVRVG